MEVTFDSNVTSLTSIKKSAYRFIDKFSVEIATEEANYKCIINFSSDFPEKERKNLKNEFLKEVLDQDLRELINKETEPIKNLILAHAFSKTGLIKDE